jgi:hypothetical protein
MLACMAAVRPPGTLAASFELREGEAALPRLR